MKILFILQNFNTYQGVEKYTYNLVRHFIKEHEIHLLTTNYNCEIIPNLIIHKKPLIKKPLWVRLLSNCYFNTKYARKIKKDYGIDIIVSGNGCSESLFCDIVVFHSCYKATIKAANEILKMESSYLKYLLYKTRRWLLPQNRVHLIIENGVLKRSKKIITVSNAIREEILLNYNIPKEKISVIPIAVNPAEFKLNLQKRLEIRKKHNLDEKTILLLFAGYDFRRKGLKYIIKSLPLLVKDNIMLIVVGKDNPKPYVKLAKNLGVLNKIIFTGFVPEIKEYYSAADIFILDSYYEGSSAVILEAMASGLIPVVSRINSNSEIIRDGFNGLLFKDVTNFREIGDKINFLLTNKTLIEQLRNNVLITAQRYSWERTARKTLEVYEEVLKERKQNG